MEASEKQTGGLVETDELAPIRDLFQDEALRKQLVEASSQEEALGVLVTAGARQDVAFSADSLRRLIDIFASPPRKPPTDRELKDVSGGRFSAAGTHVHMSCCTDCPNGGGLCHVK